MSKFSDIQLQFPQDQVRRLLRETTGHGDEQSKGAIATFICKRPELAWDFVKAIAGSVEVFGTPGGGVIERRIPLELPESPDLFARSYDMTYRGRNRESNDPTPYGWVEVRVEFAVPPFNFQDQEWTSYRSQGAANYITIPNRMFYFADGEETHADIGVLVPERDMIYTRHWLPDVTACEDLCTAMQGRINSQPFRRCPAGTVLFLADSLATSTGILGGQLASDIQLSFRYRAVPWNFALHPIDADFQIITSDAGTHPYALDIDNPAFPGLTLDALLNI